MTTPTTPTGTDPQPVGEAGPTPPPNRNKLVPILGGVIVALTITVIALATMLLVGSDDETTITDARSPSSASAGGKAATFTAQGSVTLTDDDGVFVNGDANGPGRECTGTGGFDDIKAGAQVVVKDADGTTLATGNLGEGATTNKANFADRYETCEFEFRVAGVPEGQSFYGVEVSHRGELQKTEAEMRDPQQLAFSLG